MSKIIAVLEVIEGPEGVRGRRVQHKGIPLVIGRAAQADLTIPDHRVSKNHAIIEQRANSFYLVDLESRNGTTLNGERIIRPEGAKLQHGDDISIAGHRLKFYIFSGIEESELQTIQKRITLNAINKYSNSSAVMSVEIPKFRELYTKYETKDVDALRDKFLSTFRELVHEGAPYYAQPLGERAFAFFESGSHAIEFAKELMRKMERLNLSLLRDTAAAIKKLEIRAGVEQGPLSITLGEEGRIEQVTGATVSRARQICQFASTGELLISETLYNQMTKALQLAWLPMQPPEETKLGPLYKHQSDSTAQF